jgi:hypothetical protein
MKADAEAWARDVERAIDQDVDPTNSRLTSKDTFATLITWHIRDLATYGKPLRRSKEAVLSGQCDMVSGSAGFRP